MPRRLAFSLLLATLLLTGCSDDTPPAAVSAPPAKAPVAVAATAPTSNANAGTLIVSNAAGQAQWTLRLDGSHVEVTGPDGNRLIGEARGDKRRYRSEADGAEVAEVKTGDSGFKLRTPDSQLLWKVKFGDDKIKVSANEENRDPWVLKTRYDDKAKVLDPTEAEIGEVRFYPDRTKVKAADGNERFVIDTARRSAAFGVLLMEAVPEQQRGILMVEMLSRGR